jgi:hypothetical protein
MVGVALRAAAVVVLGMLLLGAPADPHQAAPGEGVAPPPPTSDAAVPGGSATTAPGNEHAVEPVLELQAYGEAFLVPPARVVDTREADLAFEAEAPAVVPIAGRGGVPSEGAALVALNVTVTEATEAATLRVYAAGGGDHGRPSVSFGPGEAVPNLVVSRLGAGGAVEVILSAGRAHVVVDAVAWFADDAVAERGGRLVPATPWRALDTRTAGGLAPGQVVEVSVVEGATLPGDAPAPTGVVVNLTGVGGAASTFVTAYPGDQATVPVASNLNPLPGRTAPNVAFVGLSPDGTIRLANGPGATDVVVDVLAYFVADPTPTTAGRVVPLEDPFRVLDTRDDGRPLEGGSTDGWDFAAFDATAGVPVQGLVATLTAMEATQPSFITAFPLGSPRPEVSNVNVEPGRQVTNLVVTDLSGHGRGLAFYGLAGAVHHVLDVVAVIVGEGWIPLAPPAA